MHVASSICVALAAWGVHCGHPTLAQRVNGDEAIAAKQWPHHPCYGRESIQWSVEDASWAGDVTQDETCVIHLASWLQGWTYRVILCRVIVHEEGHQYGLGHSLDKDNIMYWNAEDLTYKPCDEGGV